VDKSKKQLISIIVVIIILVAIPLTIYLVRQTQIFKSKASGVPSLDFITGQGGAVLSGNPPQTDHQNDNWVRVAWNGGGGVVPSPTIPTSVSTTPIPSPTGPIPSPTGSGGSASFSANPTSFRLGDTVTVVWNNASVDQALRFFIRADGLPAAGPFGGSPSFSVSLPNCVVQPTSADFVRPFPATGTCSFTLTQDKFDSLTWDRLVSYTQSAPFTFKLIIENIGSFENIVLASVPVTLLSSSTSGPTPIPTTVAATPVPTTPPNSCSFLSPYCPSLGTCQSIFYGCPGGPTAFPTTVAATPVPTAVPTTPPDCNPFLPPLFGGCPTGPTTVPTAIPTTAVAATPTSTTTPENSCSFLSPYCPSLGTCQSIFYGCPP